jgi:dTDP-4-dehydrorhamnose 3,5-epimerase-like enzyme
MKPLEFQRVENRADSRGDSYYIPREAIDFVGAIDEIHFATILPSAIRGNHYHIGRREFILLVFSDRWRLVWGSLEGADVTTEDFDGKGAVLIQVQPRIVHAIKNTGNKPIELVSFSNKQYDPQNPDTFRKVLIE